MFNVQLKWAVKKLAFFTRHKRDMSNKIGWIADFLPRDVETGEELTHNKSDNVVNNWPRLLYTNRRNPKWNWRHQICRTTSGSDRERKRCRIETSLFNSFRNFIFFLSFKIIQLFVIDSLASQYCCKSSKLTTVTACLDLLFCIAPVFIHSSENASQARISVLVPSDSVDPPVT